MRPAARLDHYAVLATEVLRRELGACVTGVSVREDDDHAGEPSLFFEAHLDESAPVDLSERFSIGQLALRRALESEGEIRFPYLQTRRPPGYHVPDDFFVKFRDDIASRRTPWSKR